MDIEVIGQEGLDWIYLAGVGENLQDVVNTVMNFLVL